MRFSPWAESIARMCDQSDEWTEILERLPEPIQLASSLPASAIDTLVTKHLEEVYVLTDSVREALLRIAGIALGTAAAIYPDEHSFLRSLYSTSIKRGKSVQFIPVSGPAGVGKSELIDKFHVLAKFYSVSKIELDGHSFFTQQIGWHLHITSGNSMLDALKQISKYAGHQLLESRVSDASAELAQTALKNGACVLTVDELQFVVQSDRTSKISALLLQMAEIGLPVIYVANYSLVNALNERATTERKQRFLAGIEYILPELPSSADWRRLVNAYIDALGEHANPMTTDQTALDELWFRTLGLPRFLKSLFAQGLRTAWAEGRNTIAIEDIRTAYCSSGWAVNREQVEDTRRYLLGNTRVQNRHSDLLAPEITGHLFDDQNKRLLRHKMAVEEAIRVTQEAMSMNSREAQDLVDLTCSPNL